MPKTAIVRAKVEPDLKKRAEAQFSEWGMTVDEAITQFYERVTGICMTRSPRTFPTPRPSRR